MSLLRSPRPRNGVYFSILCAAIYGLTMVVTKGALQHLPPLTLLTIQTASSTIFFWIAVAVLRIRIPLSWNSIKLGLAGFLEPGFSYIFGMIGLSLTTASNATLISTMEPVVTLFLAWLILREKISPLIIALCIVACAGVGFVAAPDATSNHLGSLLGDGLIGLAVLFASLYAISTTHAVKQLPPVAVAALQQSFALIFFVVMTTGAWILGKESIEFTTATGFSLLVAIASGAFGYGLAFLLYLSAARYLSPSRISLYLTLTPVFGVIGAYWLLGEKLLVIQGLGGALILLAVIGVTRLPQQSEFPPVPRQF